MDASREVTLRPWLTTEALYIRKLLRTIHVELCIIEILIDVGDNQVRPVERYPVPRIPKSKTKKSQASFQGGLQKMGTLDGSIFGSKTPDLFLLTRVFPRNLKALTCLCLALASYGVSQ